MRWTVEMRDGSAVEVWADGFQREGEHFTFSSLFDLDEGEALPEDAVVMGETPADPRRFILAVARLPKAAVRIADGEPAIYNADGDEII